MSSSDAELNSSVHRPASECVCVSVSVCVHACVVRSLWDRSVTDRAAALLGRREGDGRKEGGMEGSDWRTKASFFAGGEELQGFLEVLDGRGDVLVLQGAASVFAVFLGLGEVLRGEVNTALLLGIEQ